MRPNKSSLADGSKSNAHLTVRFQTENETDTKPLRRRRESGSFVRQEMRSWSLITDQSIIDDEDSNHNNEQGFLTKEQRLNRLRSILSDRQKQKFQFTRHTLFGTMSDVHQILTDKYFLPRLSYLKKCLIFLDSCFRGIGQVVFANNPLSGIVITIGLFIGQWQLALYALLGTIISTLTAHFFALDSRSIQTGLYGYNGCLTALAIAHFSSGLYPWQIIGPVVMMSVCSTIIFVGLCKIFIIRLGLSSFTFSSQICSFLWLLSISKFKYFFLDPKSSLFPIVANESNVTIYSLPDISIGLFTSISQIYLLDDIRVGIIIFIGILICSPTLSMLALFGGLISQLFSAYLFGLPLEEIRHGLWSFNSVLTCQTLGGMFFILHSYHIWFYLLVGSMITIVTQAALSTIFLSMNIPLLLLPSTLVCWLFCLMAGSSSNMTAIKLPFVSIPEDHLRHFRLTNLVKKQFQFVKHLSTILEKTGLYDEISMKDLLTIEMELLPILLCSYTQQNDIKNLKTLLYTGADANSTDYDLRSPLHLAACNGNTELCLLLIKRFKANVNLVDDFGGTPLYDAFCHGHFHLTPLLYAHGARMPVEKMKELIFYLCAFSFEGNLEAVQYLIACGVNPNLTDYDGRTPLHLAVCGNRFPIVKYLVEVGNASTSVTDYYGQTAIDNALPLSNTDISEYLQQQRNDSCSYKSANIKIHIEKFSEDTDTDSDYADDDDEYDHVQMMNRSPTNIKENLLSALFCMTSANGDVEQMRNILENFPKFSIDHVDYDYRSAAHIAAAEGQLKSIQFLYSYTCLKKKGFNWMIREDRWGCTPIEEAIRHEHYELANYLKDRKPTNSKPISSFNDNSFMNLINKWKKILYFTTLASKNEVKIIEGLLSSGVFSLSENYADYDGRTPMHLAAACGHLEVVKLLQFYGDDGKTHRDRWGNCALDEARRKKFDAIVNTLLDDIV